MSGSWPRVASPAPGRSTLMTSAPNQARSCVQVGPDCTWVKSRMRTPSSALPAAPKGAAEGGGSPAMPFCGAGFLAAGLAAGFATDFTAVFFAADFTGFLATTFLAAAFFTAFLAAGFAFAFTFAFAMRVAIADSSRLLLFQHALRIEIAD